MAVFLSIIQTIDYMTHHNKKNNKSKAKRFSTEEIRKAIFDILQENNGKALNVKQFSSRMQMTSQKDISKLQRVLSDLVASKKLRESEPYRYTFMPRKKEFLEGYIEITRHGYAFVSCPELEEDVFISVKNTGNAISGDKVKITIFREPKGKRMEGAVVEIVERKRTEFVGLLKVTTGFGFVIPDSHKIHNDFFIPPDKLNGAKDGEKVVVRLKDWPAGAKSPVAEVIKILGKAGEHETEMHAILEEFGLPYVFPEEVITDAENIDAQITEEEISKRRDFRNVFTITIDPEDAKDFDDAISFRHVDENYEIGVHIADVSHYVKKGTKTDEEAYRRGTSVYLVDRTVPMLPERLSNHLCSLSPNEDKLCFSAVFTMNKKADIISQWIGKTIIHSCRRFNYEEVQKILDNQEGEYYDELKILNDIAEKLRKRRFENGSFSFETDEVQFTLDHLGKPLEITKKARLASHQLIEDLMLLANRKVAEFAEKSKRDFVYRIHEAPNFEKIAEFKRIAKKFGHEIDNSDNLALARSLNSLLEKIEGKPEQNFLESLAIRTMAKAAYSPKNIGHYGLAFNTYTHFTSPIRRYPDLMVHRILSEILENQPPVETYESLKEKCIVSSEREVNAEQADRASIKYKQVEFMLDKIGQSFEGIISGVIDGGFFVEIIENKCEGFVTASSIDEDFYQFDEFNYRLTGYNSKKTFTLGQTVWIKVVEANLPKRQLDFMLCEKPLV